MPSATVVHLAEQGVVALTGPDAGKLLQGILTNDLDVLDKGPSLAAGLLTPQGKILFDVVVYRASDGLIVETAAARLADLIKRLTLYKLRADVRITDASTDWAVVASWGGEVAWPAGSLGGADPRLVEFGERRLIPAGSIDALGPRGTIADYDARRVALGVPEGGRDYVLGDTFPHEANFDLRSGVSFTKGCYVGQEVVARMHHKTIVRKRIVRLQGTAPLASGVDVMAGTFQIGRIGTVSGNAALAFLKLDRAEELAAKGEKLTAGDVPVEIDARDIAAFEAIAAAKAHRS